MNTMILKTVSLLNDDKTVQNKNHEKFSGKGDFLSNIRASLSRLRKTSSNGQNSHYLNGILVVKYNRGGQQWKDIVAESKYAIWPNFGEARKGHILLQDHGDEVHFRNIKIKTQ